MNEDRYILFRFWFLDRYRFVSIDVVNWIFCQSYLETGNFSSKIYSENGNLFGMKLPKVRITTAIKENLGHAFYRSYIDSIDDYMLWCVANDFIRLDFTRLDRFVSKFKSTSYNPKMDSYINSINQLYSKFFVK